MEFDAPDIPRTYFAKREGCFAALILILPPKPLKRKSADVAELVDARDLKYVGLVELSRYCPQTHLLKAIKSYRTKRDLQNV